MASQALSHSVAAGIALYMHFEIFNDTASGTVEFIERINNLFDMPNSGSVNSIKPNGEEFRGTENEIIFLTQMSEMLKNIKVVDFNDKDVTSKIKCLRGHIY